ncbi:MAG: aromatic acid exporter family protein [Acholeplasma sp.]|nr:aromatic acid exporter family protein [Acholeplasma sp.]
MKTKVLNIAFKMIAAGLIALAIGKILNLQYYTTGAAIAILSIQWTKRDFIVIAIKRIISGLIAIFLAALLFYFTGQNIWMFGLFLILFILGSWLLNAPEGIVPSLVLVSHFLINKITWEFVLNEVLLLVVAILVAFIVNMLYPQKALDEMKDSLKKVDSLIELEINKIIDKLKNKDSNDRFDSSNEMKQIMSNAQMIDRDIIMQNDHRYITYLYMRNMQLSVLENIYNNVKKLDVKHEYQDIITDFSVKVSKNIGFTDKASELKVELSKIEDFFIKSELPKNRKEFEIRARLFQVLNEWDSFLNLKIEFHQKYPNFTMEGN